MTQEEAFIQTIRAVPNDDAPRFIYADWLEEQGQADRAEFIRIQCQRTRLSNTPPISGSDLVSLKIRAQDLLRSNWSRWVLPLRDIVGLRYDRYGESWLGRDCDSNSLNHFPRGFVESLSLHTESFICQVTLLSRLTALRELYLWGAGQCAAKLATVPTLSGLSLLGFVDYYDAPLKAGDAAALASSPHLHGLSGLFLGHNSLGDRGVEALARAPWLVSVRFLDLSENGLSDRGAVALAESTYLGNLQTLLLQKNTFSAVGISALTSSAKLRRLHQLGYDPPTDNGSSVESRTP